MLGAGGAYLGRRYPARAPARAILKDAPIVVLDEATAFADPENEALIQRPALAAGRNGHYDCAPTLDCRAQTKSWCSTRQRRAGTHAELLS